MSRSRRPRALAPTLATATIAIAAATLLTALSTAAQEGSSYRIGPRDRIELRVAELPDLDDDYEVRDSGSIELPIVGPVDAQGLTESELTAEIRRRLESEGLRRATVRLRVIGFRSRPVSVLGAVRTPGQQFISGRASLLEVVIAAGGLAGDAGDAVQVRRRASNGLADHVDVGVGDLFELGDPAVNIPIRPGDVIHVPRARAVRISFLGEVQSPGNVAFQPNERVTLLVAIARVGGLSETASSKIRIRHQDGTEDMVHYRRILAGRDPDPELRDGDILIVKESFF